MFFGWYIVAAALLLSIYTAGTIGFGFTAFIAPIATTFGWSYAQISLALSFRSLEVGALDPLVGVAVDRWPANRLVFIGVVMYGLGLAFISRATNLTSFYIGFLILGLGNSLAVHVVPQTAIARWFKKDLGKASAVLALGGSIGGVLVPALVKMIDTYSWQASLLILALGIWTIGIPLSFVYRARPKGYDLLTTGKLQNDLQGRDRSESYDSSVGVKEAVKTRAFWHIGIGYMLQLGSIHAVLIHIMPYLASLGIDRSTASMVTMLIPLIGLAVKIPFGWLADRFRKTYVMALAIGLTSVGLFLFWLIDGSSALVIGAFVVFFGLGLAAVQPLRTPIIKEYFGTKNFGTIYGLMGLFNMAGLLVSPPVAGMVYDTLGSYGPIWLIFSVGSVIGMILMFTTSPPRRPRRIA